MFVLHPLCITSSKANKLDNNIRVSDEWVERWGREDEAVQLPDGGYLGMLSVFHELHCIVSLMPYYCVNYSDNV